MHRIRVRRLLLLAAVAPPHSLRAALLQLQLGSLIAGRSCPLGWLTPAQQYCSAAHMAVLVLELNRSCMCVMTQQGRTLPTPSREFGVCLFEGVDTTASGVSAASLCTL